MNQVVEGFMAEQVEQARKLATVRRVDDVQPIEGADAIEVATVGGWKVVVKKGEIKPGDLALYIEIDSWVPHELAPFLSKGKDPREYNGIKGERLRTVKLRGQLSQGLLLPAFDHWAKHMMNAGDDVTELLGIQKWERPIPAQLAGRTRGNFPMFIRKTDQERCQNLKREIDAAFNNGDMFEITVKMDGSSMTVYHTTTMRDGEIVQQGGVCSRNLDLQLDQDGNAFVDTAKKSGLLDALARYGRNIAVQGELCGPGIQGNRENLIDYRYFVFDIYDIDKQCYMTPLERRVVHSDLVVLGADIGHVSILMTWAKLPSSDNIDYLLLMAEGKNDVGNEREGIVFKRMDGKFSFKAISNKYLLNGGE